MEPKLKVNICCHSHENQPNYLSQKKKKITSLINSLCIHWMDEDS